MPNLIDYKFLSDLEGGCTTLGYVPAASISKSGVTIATGFDLGQRSEQDLTRLGLPHNLVVTLKPYLGKKGQDAAALLRSTPLQITLDQGKVIDKAVKAEHILLLTRKYLTSPLNIARKDLFSLPSEAQTVIASVSFQYGVNLDRSAPKFWKAACSQDWAQTVKILKMFGDAYPTRRNKEAMLLARIVK
jgi:hypothetical protein